MSVRQEKIASVIKKELGIYFQQNAIIVAKGAMISIFGGKNNDDSFNNVVNQSKLIRHEISKVVRNQLRKMPELHFYRDDSFDYAQEIDKLLR